MVLLTRFFEVYAPYALLVVDDVEVVQNPVPTGVLHECYSGALALS
jgi:hypothetical protein